MDTDHRTDTFPRQKPAIATSAAAHSLLPLADARQSPANPDDRAARGRSAVESVRVIEARIRRCALAALVAGCFGLLSGALATPAVARTCGSLNAVESALAQKYGEHQLPGNWLAQDGRRIVLLESEATPGKRATWAMLIVSGGNACISMSGTRAMPNAPKGILGGQMNQPFSDPGTR